MDAIINHITTNKPDLKLSTAVGYAKSLQTIKNKIHNRDAELSLEMFQDVETTLNAIKDCKPAQTKNFAIALKSIYPALYADFCRQAIIDNKVDYASEQHRQQTKEKNEMNAEEIEQSRIKLEKQFKNAVKQVKISSSLLHHYLQEMQQWILFSLYFTDGLPPRRALDYLQLKFRNYDETTDNYIDLKKKMLNFNNYKTSVKFGKQMLTVPEKLLKIIKVYIKHIPDGVDTLLFRFNGHRLETASELTLKLNEILGEGKSVNAIRHHYLTSKYEDVVNAYEKINNDMQNMGSSVACVRSYIID